MALEDEIIALRKAVEALTFSLSANPSVATTPKANVKSKVEETPPEPEPPEVDAPEEKEAETGKEFDTGEYFKDTLVPAFTALATADRAKAVELLAKFGAPKLANLSPDHYQPFYAAMQGA